MKWIHTLPVLVLLAVLAYLVLLRARPLTLGTASNSFAIAAVLVIGLCLLFGPLSRFRPRWLQLLHYRKPLGLWGFAFAAVHVALILAAEPAETLAALANPAEANFLSLLAGVLAFVIFALMAATSTGSAIRRMGYRRWKALQRTGYLAFFLVLLHFAFVGSSAFVSRQLGQFLLVFALIVLLARALALLRKSAYHPDDFHEVHGIEPG